MAWFKKSLQAAGSVLFPMSMAPRAEEFTQFGSHGLIAEPLDDWPDTHWGVRLRSHRQGDARVFCRRDVPPMPRELIDYSASLTDSEREQARLGKATVTVTVEGDKQNVLRDRKRLLWFLGLIMGDDGVVAVDHHSSQLWSRGRLNDELSHEADVDITSLFEIHAVTEEDNETINWLHTHGLGNIGACDFDILRATPGLTGHAYDVLRALAFAILEGSVSSSSPAFTLCEPNVAVVRLVDAGTFDAHAPERFRRLRSLDEDHTERRVVVCEPARGLLGRWSRKCIPSRALSRELPDHMTSTFSDDATALMEERARNTYSMFRGLMEEFEELELPALAKCGFPTDHGSVEHLWFSVKSPADHGFTGELINSPFDISAMKQGDVLPINPDKLTDWVILTPVGPDCLLQHGCRPRTPRRIGEGRAEPPRQHHRPMTRPME